MKIKLFFLSLALCVSSVIALKATTDDYHSPVENDDEAVIDTNQSGYDQGFEDALANRGFSPKALQKKDYYDGYHSGYFAGLDSQSKYVEGYKKGLDDGEAVKASGKKASLPSIENEKTPAEKAFQMGYLKGFQDGLNNS